MDSGVLTVGEGSIRGTSGNGKSTVKNNENSDGKGVTGGVL